MVFVAYSAFFEVDFFAKGLFRSYLEDKKIIVFVVFILGTGRRDTTRTTCKPRTHRYVYKELIDRQKK